MVTGLKVRKTAKIRNQYNQVPHLTQDIKWESGIITIRHHKQEPRGQPLMDPFHSEGFSNTHCSMDLSILYFRNLKHPQKMFEILLTQQNIPHYVP